MSDLSSLSTPRVVVDRSKVRANISRMQSRASAAGVRLRPHAKTHKSPIIARWQIEAGAAGVCCAKLGEAEVFADAGIDDIRLPYPINPANASRVLALLNRIRLSIVVDDLEVARQWSERMVAAGRQLDVLVKVDVGTHRCGIDPDSPRALDIVRDVAGLAGLHFRGLLSHAGHSYLADSPADVEAVARQEIEILRHLTSRAREAGIEVAEISVGATPTARCIGGQHGVTEMRPGNYVFFDRTQVGLGAAALDDCAMMVVSTAVSRPAPTRVIFDAGSKTLTSDGARGFGSHPGYGLVFPSLATRTPDPAIVIERLSEEHATAQLPASSPLKPGDRVRILPNHSCVVTNLADELLLVEGSTIVDRLPVAARGRNT